MTIDKEWLSDRWEMMPEDRIVQVTLYRRLADSQLDTANPILIGAADRRDCDLSSQQLADADIEVESTSFHLYTATFQPQLNDGERIRKDWVIVDPDGRRWKAMRAKLILMDTRYKVDCIEMFGKVA